MKAPARHGFCRLRAGGFFGLLALACAGMADGTAGKLDVPDPLAKFGVVRDWTAADGRELKASVISADENTVTLLLADGKEAPVPLARLVEADRQFVAEWREMARFFDLAWKPARNLANTAQSAGTRPDLAVAQRYTSSMLLVHHLLKHESPENLRKYLLALREVRRERKQYLEEYQAALRQFDADLKAQLEEFNACAATATPSTLTTTRCGVTMRGKGRSRCRRFRRSRSFPPRCPCPGSWPSRGAARHCPTPRSTRRRGPSSPCRKFS